jgi:hypothetical protein
VKDTLPARRAGASEVSGVSGVSGGVVEEASADYRTPYRNDTRNIYYLFVIYR